MSVQPKAPAVEEHTNSTPRQQQYVPDPQVDTRRNKKRRTFSTKYKLKTLETLDACANASARGALLRREGLYLSCISAWRKQRDDGKFSSSSSKKKLKQINNNQLSRENTQLKKKLAQAEAIIELQKKISDLLGQHILPHESSEIN